MRTNYVNDGPDPSDNAYHHQREEEEYIYRARAARAMLSALRDEGSPMTEKTKKKVEKALNVELRDAMDEAREAYVERTPDWFRTAVEEAYTEGQKNLGTPSE